jgi:predicted RNA-binding protein Jag
VDVRKGKVVLDEEDYRHQQAAELRLDLVDEALAWVRATGAAVYTPPVTENP